MGAADRAGHLKGPVARVVIHAFGDGDAAGGVEVQDVTADAAVKMAGVHGRWEGDSTVEVGVLLGTEEKSAVKGSTYGRQAK